MCGHVKDAMLHARRADWHLSMQESPVTGTSEP